MKLLSPLNFILAATLILCSCNKDDKKENPPPPPENLYDYAKAENDLSIFTAALVAVGLDAELKSETELTVLAPDDQAMQAFLSDQAYADVDAWIAARGEAVVKNWLSYHLIEGKIRSDAFTTAYMPALARNDKGDYLHLYVEFYGQNDISFNGGSAEFISGNIEADNGYLHKVSNVMKLPSMGDLLKANSDFSILLQLDNYTNGMFFAEMRAEGVEHSLFAPDNTAINAYFSEQSNITNIPTLIAQYGLSGVMDIMRYHSLPQYLRAEAMSNGSLNTRYSGGAVQLSKDNSGNISLQDETGRSSMVKFTNIVAMDGIIHPIEKIILPY